MFETPVALVIFRRPALTERVLGVLSTIRPRKLLVIADGPRADRPEEAELCAATRAVIDRVDWDCEVLKNYSDVNLGCGRRPATGFDWVFEQVEEAIILEDDCIPEQSFFLFCEMLLARYREDERVMHIGGSTYRTKEVSVPHSYYFSRFSGCWGWASWRRAWKLYDFSLSLWPAMQSSGWLKAHLNNEVAYAYWAGKFQAAYERRPGLTYWDYQWEFACWANSGLAIVPRQNLISNVGHGEDATHTFHNPLLDAPRQPMTFPLLHPPSVLANWRVDREFLQEVILPSISPKPVSPLIRFRRVASHLTPDFIKELYHGKGGSRRPWPGAAPDSV